MYQGKKNAIIKISTLEISNNIAQIHCLKINVIDQ